MSYTLGDLDGLQGETGIECIVTDGGKGGGQSYGLNELQSVECATSDLGNTLAYFDLNDIVEVLVPRSCCGLVLRHYALSGNGQLHLGLGIVDIGQCPLSGGVASSADYVVGVDDLFLSIYVTGPDLGVVYKSQHICCVTVDLGCRYLICACRPTVVDCKGNVLELEALSECKDLNSGYVCGDSSLGEVLAVIECVLVDSLERLGQSDIGNSSAGVECTTSNGDDAFLDNYASDSSSVAVPRSSVNVESGHIAGSANGEYTGRGQSPGELILSAEYAGSYLNTVICNGSHAGEFIGVLGGESLDIGYVKSGTVGEGPSLGISEGKVLKSGLSQCVHTNVEGILGNVHGLDSSTSEECILVDSDEAIGKYYLGNCGESIECSTAEGQYALFYYYLSDLSCICSVGLILCNIYKVVLGRSLTVDNESSVGAELPVGLLAAGSLCDDIFYLDLTLLAADVTVSVGVVVVYVTGCKDLVLLYDYGSADRAYGSFGKSVGSTASLNSGYSNLSVTGSLGLVSSVAVAACTGVGGVTLFSASRSSYRGLVLVSGSGDFLGRGVVAVSTSGGGRTCNSTGRINSLGLVLVSGSVNVVLNLRIATCTGVGGVTLIGASRSSYRSLVLVTGCGDLLGRGVVAVSTSGSGRTCNGTDRKSVV